MAVSNKTRSASLPQAMRPLLDRPRKSAGSEVSRRTASSNDVVIDRGKDSQAQKEAFEEIP